MAYRLLLTVTDETSEYNGREFIFDMINQKSVSKSVDITTHPLVSGDLVGDHMYKNAPTVSIGGKFSLNGSKYSNFEGEGDRLSNIQAIFEKLMDNGTILNLKTSQKEDNKLVTRFLERSNMVLNSIDWTENYNNLDFSFRFMQIMFSELQEEIEYLDDNTLKALTDAVALSFSEDLVDINQMNNMIMQILYDSDVATKDFWTKTNLEEVLKPLGIVLGAQFIAGIAALAAIGITYGAVAAGATATAIASGPIGWIVLAASAIVIGCGIVIYKQFIKASKNEINIRKFKYYQNAKKREKEEDRFKKLIKYLVDATNSLSDYVKGYDITSDQNQELLLYIDDNYYIFNFERNNTTANDNEKGYYDLEVLNIEGKTVSYGGKIKAEGSANFTEAATRCLFKTDNGHYIYLMNKEIEKIKSYYTTENGSEKENPELQQKIKEAQYDLSNFYVLDAQFDIAEFENVVADIIREAMMGFKEDYIQN